MFLIKTRLKKLIGALGLGLLVCLAPAAIATAACNDEAQSCSNSFQVTESFFGAGGQFACTEDGEYCANQSVGELGVGNTSSPNFQAQGGFNTNRMPYIEFIINTPSINFGVLDPEETHVGEASFSVKTYLAHGYQVTNEALPPSIAGHTFATSTIPGASSPGDEQFGMNLVENSCPATAPSSGLGSCSGTFGANHVQEPDNTFSFGEINENYDDADMYSYENHAQIARSDLSSGTTNYTISYLFNISPVTPAGEYRMNHVLVATSTF